MHIAPIKFTEEEEFDRVALNYGNTFNASSWAHLLGNTANLYGFFDKGDRLCGGFTVYTEKRVGARICRNPPFTPYMGPFLVPVALNPSAIQTATKHCLSLMSDFFDRLGCLVIRYTFNPSVIDMQPFIWRKYKCVPAYTYVLDLSYSTEDLWQRMASHRRNDIRRALKEGFVAMKINCPQTILKLAQQTFARRRIQVDGDFLNRLLFSFANEKNSFTMVAFNKETEVAGAFCVFDRHTAYYLIGGIDTNKGYDGAQALVLWQSILYAKSLGLASFDLEGSMVPTIEKFFRQFGGELVPIFTINKAWFPVEIALKFWKREYF